MVLKSVKSIRKGEGDYGGKDLWKRLSLSLELKKERSDAWWKWWWKRRWSGV